LTPETVIQQDSSSLLFVELALIFFWTSGS